MQTNPIEASLSRMGRAFAAIDKMRESCPDEDPWEKAREYARNLRWEVGVYEFDGGIKVEAHKGIMSYSLGEGAKFVHPPDWFERRLGITYEDKINKAVRWCKQFCERENAKLEAGRLPEGYVIP